LQDRAGDEVGVAGGQLDDDLAAEGVADQGGTAEAGGVDPGGEGVGQLGKLERAPGFVAAHEPGRVGGAHGQVGGEQLREWEHDPVGEPDAGDQDHGGPRPVDGGDCVDADTANVGPAVLEAGRQPRFGHGDV
jgi:hypothetical protein